MNADKTNIMIFPKTKANDICVKLSGITITKVQSINSIHQSIYLSRKAINTGLDAISANRCP